jgi:DNA-binding SARP family transcriptional activator
LSVDLRSGERSSDERVKCPGPDQPAHLTLLGGFELARGGQVIPLPSPAQRLVAFLAVRGGQPLSRAHVAGTQWLDASQERALASLRSAVWRTRRCEPGLLEADASHLRLGDGVSVDSHDKAQRAHRLIEEPVTCEEHELSAAGLTGELLPDWLDDWVLFERERLRQLFLHALESLSRRLSALGRHAAAVEASGAVVQQEPLRETGHRALIEAHLAEGNRNEAIRQYRVYRKIMRDELDLEPSPRFTALLEHALQRPLR